MPLQKLVRVRQHVPEHRLENIPSAVFQALEEAPWTSQVSAGRRIALGVGSRGIENLDVIVRAIVDFWKSRRVDPFIIPVMGSHGSATAQGQAAVLDHFGISEGTMGVPVVSSLDVVPVGVTPEGMDVVMDRNAFESDGVMLCSRIKWHTDFEGRLESGPHKMMTVGLGKWSGARRFHVWAQRIGMEQVMRSVGRVMLDSGKILGGLAILEDASHQTAEVHVLGVDGMAEREEALLARVKSWKANLPAEAIDLVIVDVIGKDISGAGMDTKVINRSSEGPNRWSGVPIVQRVYARDLSPRSYGNGIGAGFADMISDRLHEKIDRDATWVNGLTSTTLLSVFTPMHFASDRICIDHLATTCGKTDVNDCTIAWIENTLRLGDLMVSENLLPELRSNPSIEVFGGPCELPFDEEGNLVSVFSAQPGTR